MAKLTLPDQTYLSQCFSYDAESGWLFWRSRPNSHFSDAGVQKRWNTKHSGKRAGFVGGTNRYRGVGVDGVRYKEHRIIWKLVTGQNPDQIDHRDCDGHNNRWDNLRDASHETNVMNQRGWSGRTLPKGVYPHWKKWRAQIQVNGKLIGLGSHETPDAAHKAYCAAATRFHTEFANHGVQRTRSPRRSN